MTSRGGLDLDLRLRRGDLDLALALHVAPGEVVALVGPNGSGKSTVAQLVAGLIAPDEGVVRCGGATWADGPRVVVDVADRRVGMVFQELRLFDHLSARDNVAFGPRSRGASTGEAAATADRWLDAVGLAGMGGARPGALSGGQRQRVALARALASDPSVLVLDEPLSALDAETRSSVRTELRRHLLAYDGPALLITHEPTEALALADRLVVLEGGRVSQAGTAAEVAARPATPWVARLLGLNLLTGVADGV